MDVVLMGGLGRQLSREHPVTPIRAPAGPGRRG